MCERLQHLHGCSSLCVAVHERLKGIRVVGAAAVRAVLCWLPKRQNAHGLAERAGAGFVTLIPFEIGKRLRTPCVGTTAHHRGIKVEVDDAASNAAVTTAPARASTSTAVRTTAAGRCLHRGPSAGQPERECRDANQKHSMRFHDRYTTLFGWRRESPARYHSWAVSAGSCGKSKAVNARFLPTLDWILVSILLFAASLDGGR